MTDKKEIDLLVYACVLARMYSLALGSHLRRDPLSSLINDSLFGPNPYVKKLEDELAEIHKFLDGHKCRENDVVNIVRQAIPSTNWDGAINKVLDEVMTAFKNNEDLTDSAAKLKALSSPDWEERLKLEELYDK